jgi:hypothetical protein
MYNCVYIVLLHLFLYCRLFWKSSIHEIVYTKLEKQNMHLKLFNLCNYKLSAPRHCTTQKHKNTENDIVLEIKNKSNDLAVKIWIY